jgi:hypothetical protein
MCKAQATPTVSGGMKAGQLMGYCSAEASYDAPSIDNFLTNFLQDIALYEFHCIIKTGKNHPFGVSLLIHGGRASRG